MNKTQLINWVSRQTKLNRTEAANAVNSTLQGIMRGSTSREGARLAGFGSFKCQAEKTRTYNRRTKRYTWKTVSKNIQFSPNKSYREFVN